MRSTVIPSTARRSPTARRSSRSTLSPGTITTASGPHPGDHDKELVRRFDFKGADTLEWIVQRHATMAILFGLATLVVLAILMRKGGDRRAVRPVAITAGLIGFQIALGITQWLLELPAILVWFHVVTATLIWIAVLWSVATAGQIDYEKGKASARAAPGVS